VQGKYLRWVLGVDRETPGYIVMKECKRNRQRVKASGKERIATRRTGMPVKKWKD
jgi:hypothetical protein